MNIAVTDCLKLPLVSGVTPDDSCLILNSVKFSLLMGLKSNNFVFDSFRESLFTLRQFVTNFSSLLMTSDITKRFLLPYNRLIKNGRIKNVIF